MTVSLSILLGVVYCLACLMRLQWIHFEPRVKQIPARQALADTYIIYQCFSEPDRVRQDISTIRIPDQIGKHQ
ncbi:hypothetical protein GGS24DRAFT_467924 [Hypoxylon argillaceum]|nr:hypothetical protein GGS24DRAFT_467924 [Hypoxylon argillaceum]